MPGGAVPGGAVPGANTPGPNGPVPNSGDLESRRGTAEPAKYERHEPTSSGSLSEGELSSNLDSSAGVLEERSGNDSLSTGQQSGSEQQASSERQASSAKPTDAGPYEESNSHQSGDWEDIDKLSTLTVEQLEKQLYFVRTADGEVYGPTNAKKILRWGHEGRLDSQASVRQDGLDFWLSYPAWKAAHLATIQRVKARSPKSAAMGRDGNRWDAIKDIYREKTLARGTARGGSAVPIGAPLSSFNGHFLLMLSIFNWLLCPMFPITFMLSVILLAITYNALRLDIRQTVYRNDKTKFEQQRIFFGIALVVSGIQFLTELLPFLHLFWGF